MAEEDDLRRVEAELEFLSLREQELRKELNEQEAAFGEPVTKDSVGGIVAGVAEAMRRSGNEVLADRYVSAFNRFQAANYSARNFASAGEVNETANEAMNDAAEDFERVGADVQAWFDGRLKGGA